MCGWPATNTFPGLWRVPLEQKQDKEQHKDREQSTHLNMQTKGTWKPQNHDNYNNQNQTITSHWHNNQELIVSTRSLFFHLFLLMKMFLMFKSSFALYYCFCCVFLVLCPCSWTYSLLLTMVSALALCSVWSSLSFVLWFCFLNLLFLCSWSCSVFLLLLVFVLCLYYSVHSLLFVLCPWSRRGGFLLPHAGHHAKLPPSFSSINHPLRFLFIVFVPCSWICSLLLMLSLVLILCLLFWSFLFCFVLKLWFGGVWYCSLFLLFVRCPLFVFVVYTAGFVLLVFFVSDLAFALKNPMRNNEEQTQ